MNGEKSVSTKFYIGQTVILVCYISIVENCVWSFSGVLDESSGTVQSSVNNGSTMSPPFALTAGFGRSTLQFMVNSGMTGVHNVTCRRSSLVNPSPQNLIVEIIG